MNPHRRPRRHTGDPVLAGKRLRCVVGQMRIVEVDPQKVSAGPDGGQPLRSRVEPPPRLAAPPRFPCRRRTDRTRVRSRWTPATRRCRQTPRSGTRPGAAPPRRAAPPRGRDTHRSCAPCVDGKPSAEHRHVRRQRQGHGRVGRGEAHAARGHTVEGRRLSRSATRRRRRNPRAGCRW